jgi:streptogramin lyase
VRPQRKLTLAVAAAAMTAVCAGLAGCGAGSMQSSPFTAEGIRGNAMGGGQPLSNATIQLYAPGTTGYGSASTPLFTHPVTTDQNGNFAFGGAYTCPSDATPVYLVATGGNPGLPPGTNNQAAALMSLIGQCGSLNSKSFFNLSELSTVAAVWAMQPFMLDYAHIGTTAGNVQGLLNAYATAQSLVDIRYGTTPGQAPPIANIPSVELNTLASILAACVNTNGSTSALAPCGRLFNTVTPPGSPTPTETIAAALDIARFPSHSVGAIFNIVPPNAPYQPTLTNAPGDWTVSINYASPALNTPSDLAIDSQGNAWVLANASGGSSSVSVLNIAAGIEATFPQPGSHFVKMALDPYDDAWLTSTITSSVTELNSGGSRATLNPFSGGGLQAPSPLAFDGYGNVWVGNNIPTVSKLSPNGAPLSPGTGYNTGGSSGPVGIAVDTTGNVWMADAVGSSIEVLSNSGASIPGSPYTGGGISGPFALAIDSTGGAWVANRTGSSLSRVTSFGSAVAGSPYYGGGLNAPIDLGLDGLGNVWLVNSGSNSVSEFLSTGHPQSGASGYGSSALQNPFRMGIDRSGDVWVANLGSSVPGSGLVTQIVGVAAPAVTPQSLALQNNAIGQRP